MAEKNGVTEVQALNALIDFARANGFEGEGILEKADHMVAVRSKKRERKPDDSKRLANIALGEKFAETWTGGEFKAADVAATLDVSVAKASAIAKVMEWEQVPSTEKVKVYTL